MAAQDLHRRTLPATPRRVQDFRRRGQIALSRDLTMVATIAGATLVASFYLSRSIEGLTNLFQETFQSPSSFDAARLFMACVRAIAITAGPAIAGALIGYLIAVAGQLGAPPAFVTPKVDFSRLFKPSALLDFISIKAQAGRALKATAKLLAVVVVSFFVLRYEWKHFLRVPTLEARPLIWRLVDISFHVAFASGGLLGILAVVDYVRARRRIGAEMRMTPEEMRREMREQEGDPHIKRKRRQRMIQLAKRRVTAAVKSSDVVVVNPTEFAVAIRYRSKKDRAPRVVAKGRGPAAEHIRTIAREAGVPIMPNVLLARALFKLVPEGREVPPHLYRAVAELLAYVFRVARRGPR